MTDDLLYRPKKLVPDRDERPKQRALFAGLDCLSCQRDLFATDGEPDRGERPPASWCDTAPPPAWTRTPGIDGGTCGASWSYGNTGWRVRHCGHPTALWPYYIELPDGSLFRRGGGRPAYQTLAEAKAVLEREYARAASKRQAPLGETTGGI